MPRFFAKLCLQKMRNGIGRPHAGILRDTFFAENSTGMGERTIQQPTPRASSFL